MADALAKYRAALKKYRKENPNVAFRTAQQKVAAEMKSGKVSGAKKKKATVKGIIETRNTGHTSVGYHTEEYHGYKIKCIKMTRGWHCTTVLDGKTVSAPTKKDIKHRIMRYIKKNGEKTITGYKRKRITGALKVASSKTIGRVEKGEALIKEIDKLERKRAAISRKELRDLIQLEINGLHHKFDRLTRPQASRKR